MGNSLRCCLACMLPCGALDMIRIVHINGYIEEIPGPITAGEVLKNNPNHVLSKPCSESVVRRIPILSPESELKRGTIYFLIPNSSMPQQEAGSRKKREGISKKASSKKRKTKCDVDGTVSETESEKKAAHRDRRRSRVCVWRPHLESISEDL